MNNVIALPSSVRIAQDVRFAVNKIAERVGAAEAKRRHAVAHAIRVLTTGSSSAWAIQAARQDLREPARVAAGDGPRAA